MTSPNPTPAPLPPTAPAVTGSYVDWPAIFMGAVIAAAIAFVFGTFGVGLGLSMVSPYEGDGSATAEMLAVGSWILWTTISSVMAGAYVAGRMRRRVDAVTEDEISVRDGTHGLAVWGVALLVGALLISGTLGSALNLAAESSDAVAQVATEVTDAGAAEEATEQVAAAANEITEAEAAALAETARKYAIVSAFIMAAAQLIAAAGAYWAAGVGGNHRDEQRVFARFGRWT